MNRNHATAPCKLAHLAIALPVMCLGLPASAEVYMKGVTGSGLYDFLIQTNCYAVSAQMDTRTPSWITDGTYPDNRVPLLAAGASTGIVRTVDLADQITFFSSNPAVIPPPAKIQAVGAIGGVGYQPTEVPFTIKAPSRPTNVDITAQGSASSVIGMVAQLGQAKRVTRKFRVYPPQKISKATIGPAKPAPYTEGERLRIDVTLPWKIPISTTIVMIGMPVFKDRWGNNARVALPEWRAPTGFYLPKRIEVPPNTDTLSFEFAAKFPPNAAVERLGVLAVQTSLVVPVELKVNHYGGCLGLVTSPTSIDISYKMQKLMKMPTPTATSPAPSPIQQAPLPQPTSGSIQDGVLAPREPLPTKPDAEPEDYPKPRPRRQ